MKVEFDREADAIYVTWSDKRYAFGEDIDHERCIDYAADGTPIGIEFTCMSEGVAVGGLPRRAELARAIEGSKLRIVG